MGVQQHLNEKYTLLCQKLGDLSLKKEKAELEIQAIKEELETIIKITPELLALETKIHRKAANETSKCADCPRCDGTADIKSGSEREEGHGKA